MFQQHRDREVAQVALARQATDFVPEYAVCAAISREDGVPVLAAVADGRLYLLGVAPGPPELDQMCGTCWMTALDPTRSSVRFETARENPLGSVVRRTSWHFAINGEFSLTFDSACGPDVDDHQHELFAHALADAVGCPLPPLGYELAEAA